MPHEPFDLDVGSGVVSGALRAPDRDGPAPAVLVCSDLPGSALDEVALVDAVTSGLLHAGMAVAHADLRRDDEATVANAAATVDDALAVLQWMQMRDDIDGNRVGVIGVSLGTIVAGCLAGRTDRINRLCLFAPITSAEAVSRLAKPGDLPLLLRADGIREDFLASLAALTPDADAAVHRQPTLIVQGAADRVARPQAARPYLAAIDRDDHHVERELIARAAHDLGRPELLAIGVERIVRFFVEMAAPARNGQAR